MMDQRVENASAEAVVRRAADFGADVVGLSVMTPYSSNLGFLTEGLRAALRLACSSSLSVVAFMRGGGG